MFNIFSRRWFHLKKSDVECNKIFSTSDSFCDAVWFRFSSCSPSFVIKTLCYKIGCSHPHRSISIVTMGTRDSCSLTEWFLFLFQSFFNAAEFSLRILFYCWHKLPDDWNVWWLLAVSNFGVGVLKRNNWFLKRFLDEASINHSNLRRHKMISKWIFH